MRAEHLRRGDIVEVRNAAEILATLDEQGSLEALPFMPEMVGYCGRRFSVDRRTEKVCDTIKEPRSRRMTDCVFLDDVRCDGSGHDGCQAECRFYWKEAWLKRVAPTDPAAETSGDHEARHALLELVTGGSRTRTREGEVRYLCQATEMLSASQPLSLTDPRPYLREYTSGNVSIRTFSRVMTRVTVTEVRRKLGRLPAIPVHGKSTKSPETQRLDLQPGEWVRVKSRDQIRETLTDKGMNRGLWFDVEMLPYCGKTFRVRRRIERFVNDRDGTMIELPNDCVTLEGVVCSGELSPQRWFCSRAIYSYWRECWLERVRAERVRADHSSVSMS
ncbi:MAG: hypothetical protein ACRD0W_12920 [Acidimicrobiales bacterium]